MHGVLNWLQEFKHTWQNFWLSKFVFSRIICANYANKFSSLLVLLIQVINSKNFENASNDYHLKHFVFAFAFWNDLIKMRHRWQMRLSYVIILKMTFSALQSNPINTFAWIKFDFAFSLICLWMLDYILTTT